MHLISYRALSGQICVSTWYVQGTLQGLGEGWGLSGVCKLCKPTRSGGEEAQVPSAAPQEPRSGRTGGRSTASVTPAVDLC